MTRFIHLTDLHVSHPEAGDVHLQSDTPAALKRVVKTINAMVRQPDFVVASGDLTNMGDVASYGLVRETFAALNAPLVLALGNHDTRAGFNEVFAPILADSSSAPILGDSSSAPILGDSSSAPILGDSSSAPILGDAPYFHDAVHGDLHVITLDTGVPGQIAGAIDDAQFDYLEHALARHAGKPKLLVMHHPPRVDPDGLSWGSLDMQSTERLAELLRHQRVAGILSGHIHINRVSHWHGIPIVISNGQHSTVDLLETADLRIVEGTGFAICDWRASGLSVSFVPLSPETRQLGLIDQARLRAFS